MLNDELIRDFSGNQYTFEELQNYIKIYNDDGYEIFIGSDSQVIKNKVNIVTALCFVRRNEKNESGKVFYTKTKVNRKEYPTLRSRMLLEAYRSIEAAMQIEEWVSSELTIHLDVGDTIKSKTSSYHKELQALVKGQGYKCAIKPDSWASSSVADKVSKG